MCAYFVLLGTLEQCAAHVAALGGRSKPERLCVRFACVHCVLLLVLATAQLLMLLPCGGCGARSKPERLRVRFACVRFVLVGTLERCAAHVAALGGRRKPERLRAFCVWAFCLTPQKLQDQGAGANPNACVHFACVRFACVHLCAAKVAGSGGRRKPERLRAFFFFLCVCVCVPFACVHPCAAKVVCVRAPLRRESCRIRGPE